MGISFVTNRQQNGKIEKGTWRYVSEILIKHLDISGIMIDKADAEIEYTIVVGGVCC